MFWNWTGKTTDDYRGDLGLLEFEERSNVSMGVHRNLTLCREIDEIVRKC